MSLLKKNWLAPLLAALEDPLVGAAGSKLLSPNGLLQEAGCTMSACGTAVQHSRNLNSREPLFNRGESIDYCSGAALAVRKRAFERAIGLDPCWDPVYFEDADLCFKLKLLGLRTVYVPQSEVVHLEHVTVTDPSLGLALHNAVATNRLKFVERWGEYLMGGICDPPTAIDGKTRAAPAPQDRRERLGLYSPHPLYAGGGERYLLSIAAALQDRFHCFMITPERYSALRLQTVARDLDIDIADMEMLRFDEAARQAPVDLFVCMSNQALPHVPAIGKRNVFHCQFPFPLAARDVAHQWSYLRGYNGLIVNSQFSALHLRREADRLGVPCRRSTFSIRRSRRLDRRNRHRRRRLRRESSSISGGSIPRAIVRIKRR
jgi:hypothetical protein